MMAAEASALARLTTARAPIEIKAYTPDIAAHWDAYAQQTPAASFCHLAGWQHVIERVWRHSCHSLYAERAGRLVGILPLFHVRSPWFGSMLVSTPNAVYGGVVADDAEAQSALLASARQRAAELKVDFLELRNTLAQAPSADESLYREFHLQDGLYVHFDCPLVADEAALLNSFPRDIRRMIRQGPKHGLTAELQHAEALDDFYEVYALSLRKLGTPVFPKRLFAEFLREFPAADILVIRQGRRLAGAVLSFYFRDTVLPYYAGARPEFYRTGVNNFMYAELMRLSAARGYMRFDFGRSKRGTGAYEFKRGWGMQEHVLPYRIALVNARHLPNLNPANPKYKLLIEVWKRLPLSLTKLLGPPLVKYLP